MAGNDVGAAAYAAIRDGMAAGQYPWWYPEGAKGKAIDYFVYGTDYTPLAAAATTVNNINISGDSAFCILSAVLVETDTTNLVLLPFRPLLFRLQDTGSGRYLSNHQVHADNWFGTAEEPKYWDVPKILAPNTTFNVECQNLDGVNGRNVRVDFHGFKIFGFRP